MFTVFQIANVFLNPTLSEKIKIMFSIMELSNNLTSISQLHIHMYMLITVQSCHLLVTC